MRMPFCLQNVYRAKWCAKHHVPLLPKLFMLLNSIVCGCDISYKAQLPRTTGFSHRGLGVVIGGGAVIGEHTMIAHGVTIGNRMPADGGHPTIGCRVYIGSGAYLGGGIHIGDNARIGAHTVVLRDVPERYTAVGNPMRLIPPKI